MSIHGGYMQKKRWFVRLQNIVMLVMLNLGIAGCSFGGNSRAPSAPVAPSVAATTGLRFIVSFNSLAPSTGSTLNERVRRDSGALAVTYAAPLGKDTHLFSIQPETGQSAENLLVALKKIPYITSVEMDSKAAHH